MPYKYILDVESTPFEEAPPFLMTAMQRLRWAGSHVGQSEDEQFNEMLAVGYYADGKMGVSNSFTSIPSIGRLSDAFDSTTMMGRKNSVQSLQL